MESLISVLIGIALLVGSFFLGAVNSKKKKEKEIQDRIKSRILKGDKIEKVMEEADNEKILNYLTKPTDRR